MPTGISAHAASTPDKVAIVDGERSVTYAELDRRTDRLAELLAQTGVAAGDTVAVMLPNGSAFFEAGTAVSKLDASMVPVNWHLTAEELAWILGDSSAAVLVADSSLRDSFAGSPCPVIQVGSDGELAGLPAEAPVREAGPAPAPVFYTSGTTGRPKGVMHGLADRARMAMAQDGQAALWSWTPDDVYLLSGPAYHAGPGGWAWTALYVGATLVVLPSFDAREWLRLVDRHRVTKSFMVPAHFIRILEVDAAERGAFDLSRLRLIAHAAAPCPVDVKWRIMEALDPCEIWELYGASEGGATRIAPQEWRERPGSVGLPWPGVEVRILDADGRRLPPGETGAIYVRPPGGTRFHYHDDPEKTAQAWRDDAFTVGDVGHLDDDGYLFITDRATDMVIRGGVNVYPREVEEVLHAHPSVVDCAVFGVPDDRLGEQLRAIVEVRAGDAVTPNDLAAHCGAHLASYKWPRDFELVHELPRDASGKVRKRLLREAYWQDRPSRI